MVITSFVMDVMHFITISCNLKIDALHFTHHYLKKCNDCNVLPLHITIKQYTLPLPQVCCDCKKLTNKPINVRLCG